MAKQVKKEWKQHCEQKARIVDYKSVLSWEAVYTLERLIELFNGKTEFSYDSETTGLDYTKAKLAGFSFSFDGNIGYYVPIAHKKDTNAPRECLDYIVSKICDNNMIVLMFNKKFDLNILELCEGYKIGVRYNVKDCQALVWLRDTDFTYPSLKWASEHFLGIVQPRYEEVVGEHTFDYALVSDVLEYAALDAICTKRLIKQTFEKHPGLRCIFDIDDISIEAIRKFEHEKIQLDIDWLKNEETRVHFLLKEIEKKVYGYTGYEFNINSTQQTADALLRVGAILTQRTPGGKFAVSEDVLSKIEHPVAKLLVEHSHLSTYLSTFVKNLIGGSDIEGRIRFNYKTCSVVTGRFSSGGDSKNSYYAALNAQNIPKPVQVLAAMVQCTVEESVTGWKMLPIEDVALIENVKKKNDNISSCDIVGAKEGYKKFYIVETGTRNMGLRCSFLPDDEESVWVSIDYAGQELRIAANFSEEPVFVNAFLTGGDPHMETARKIWGPNANKNHRRDAKGANFALQYGGTGYTLAQNLGISKQEGDAFYNSYRKAMHVLVSWQDYMRRIAKRDGVVYSAFGRPFRLKKFFLEGVNRGQQACGERCALNYPIQGSGGDVIRLALSKILTFWLKMKQANINGFSFKSTVHDEVNFSVKKSFLHTFMRYVPGMMRTYFPEWKVPLDVDVSIGPNWCEVVPYKYDIENKVYTPKGDLYEF